MRPFHWIRTGIGEKMRPARTVRGRRPRTFDEAGQQAIALVLGIVLLMVTSTAVLVTTTTQHLPIISQAQVDHDAYRALEAGLNEFLFVVNNDPSAATCTAGQYALYTAGTGGSVCSAFATAGIKFGQWNQVNTHTGPNVAPEWFLFGDPTAVTNTSQTSNTASIRLSVVGAAGYPQGTSNGSVEYQSANVALSPADGFLLNVWWTDFEVGDPFQSPPVSGGVSELGVTSCPYFWQPDPAAGTRLADGSTFDGSTNADPCMGAPIAGSGGAIGDHLITANYTSNNPTYGGGGASLTEQVMSSTTATTTSVTASPAAPALNQSVTYTASVSSALGGDTVGFTDNGTPISGCSTQPVTGGLATCTVSGGYTYQTSHVITATFSGDATYATSAGSKTVFVGSSSFGTTTTTVVVTSSGSPQAAVNSAITYTATLKAGATNITGASVGFTDDGTAIAGCTAQTTNAAGVATCSTTTPNAVGWHRSPPPTRPPRRAPPTPRPPVRSPSSSAPPRRRRRQRPPPWP